MATNGQPVALTEPFGIRTLIGLCSDGRDPLGGTEKTLARAPERCEHLVHPGTDEADRTPVSPQEHPGALELVVKASRDE